MIIYLKYISQFRMMLLGLLLLLMISGLVIAEQGPDCYCYSYFLCTNHSRQNKNFNCSYPDEVCCKMSSIPDNTHNPPNKANSSTTVVNKYPEGNCGIRKRIMPGDNSKTLSDNDTKTHFGEFPWMVALLKKTPSGNVFLCGGSIIQSNVILTAAHAISGIPKSELIVRAGMWNSSDDSERSRHQDREVSESIVHSNFGGILFEENKIANDFAILVLDEPLEITDNVATVCLPPTKGTINKTSCIATGWGVDIFGKHPKVLKKVDIRLVEFNTCKNKIKSRHTLHNSFICAGGGVQSDTCTGDGGGPLMCAMVDNPDQYVQVGITSFGFGCGRNVPGVYASVEYASEWIKHQLRCYTAIGVRSMGNYNCNSRRA